MNFVFYFSAYEYPQSLSDLENCQDFPSIQDFFNSLRGESLSQEDYDKSKKIYKDFCFKNLLEYMEIYCALDVFLLAEVFTLFRKETLANFGIDPLNYVSLPGLGFDCFLKKTGVRMDYVYSGIYFRLFYFSNKI